MTLAALTERLRKRVTEYRHTRRMDPKIQAPINMIEIALGLAEFGMDKSRPVGVNEEYWFDGGWDMIHKLDRTEWDDLVDLYRELGFKVKERNWFRLQ